MAFLRAYMREGALRKDHRTEDRKGNSKNKPDELKDTAPNQVWMWDITCLKTDFVPSVALEQGLK